MNQRQMLLLAGAIVTAGMLTQAAPPDSGDSRSNRIAVLEADLARLGSQVQEAEDDLIEFERLHQTDYVQLKGQAQFNHLKYLINEHAKVSLDMWNMELEHPFLGDTKAPPLTYETVSGQPQTPRTVSPTDSRMPDNTNEVETVRAAYRRLLARQEGIDKATRRWQDSYLLASRKNVEFNHRRANLERLEATYKELADELHALRMQRDLKSLQQTK